jgi:hypothetical protein
MTMRVRAGFMVIAALATIVLAGCDHYNCNSGPILSGSCTASGSGLGSNAGGGSATAAFVFVADETGGTTTGTIDGYTLNTTALTFGPTPSFTAPATPLNDLGVGMVVAQKKYLYTGFGSTNTIYGWSISATGTLTAVTGSPIAAPFMGFVPFGFGTQSIATNPAGTLLFFSSTGPSGPHVYVYQIGTDGSLTAAAGSPFAASFAGNMATDGLGKYLYVTDALGNHTGFGVAAFSIGSTGALTAVVGSPFAGPTYSMWQVQGEPTGNFLIGTTGKSVTVNGGDDNNLYVFSIAQSGTSAGALTVNGAPVATQSSPLNIAVQSNTNGNLVYAFGVADTDLAFNPVEGFAISTSGALTTVNGSPFISAALGDQGAFDQSGAFLFVYGGIVNSGTNTVTFQMGALDVASGGALTQPTSTLTLTSGGFFAVTDPQ